MTPPRSRGTGLTAALLAVACLASAAAGQEPTLPGDLPAETIAALRTELARAREAGLPTRPLVLKALEGRSKGATDDQIVHAVEGLRERLVTAGEALGTGRREDVLVAAAGALYVGADTGTLRAMAHAADGDALAMALVVLGDLVRRGVPVEAAGTAVLSLAEAAASADVLREFRRSVDDDIRTGLAPTRATEVRLQGTLLKVRGRGPGGWD
jgi:hypothetical protein